MDLVVNFLLLAASGVACFYCIVLSRRLKGLTDAKGGLGAGVAALSRSAEEMKTALTASRKSADEATVRLQTALREADVKMKGVRRLMEELTQMSASLSNNADEATKKYVDALAPIINEASEAADRLFEAIDSAPQAPSFPTMSMRIGADMTGAPRMRRRGGVAA